MTCSIRARVAQGGVGKSSGLSAVSCLCAMTACVVFCILRLSPGSRSLAAEAVSQQRAISSSMRPEVLAPPFPPPPPLLLRGEIAQRAGGFRGRRSGVA